MPQYDYLQHLRDNNLEDYELLTSRFKPKTFKKGDFITELGQTPQEIHFIQSGIQMSYFEAENKTHVTAFTYAPDICAVPDAFIFQRPSKYFFTCLTDTETFYLTYNDLQAILDASHRIERLFRIMTEAILAGLLERQVELQSTTIEERFKAFCRRSSHLLQLVPHKYIASYYKY